jgi:NitT/TauT family transport system permease protein/sulfonate transport system permease protein
MKIIKRCLPFLFIIVVWQVLVHLKWVNEFILPAPVDIFKAFIQLIKSGELLFDILNSLKRVGIGFLLASVCGVSLGLAAAYSRILSETLTPIFEFLRPIPPIAWIPIAILWFGLGDSPAYFIVFVGAFFPIFINTYWGIRSSKVTYVNVARNFGASRFMILTDVLLPASLPDILRGLKIGLGLAWTSVISAELVGAQSGLGYMIQLNRIMLKTYNIIVGMITIGVVGLAMNYLMTVCERKLTFWNKETIGALEQTKKQKQSYD